MIQRIQSIYLVLAGFFSAFTFFEPVCSFIKQEASATYGFCMSSCEYYNQAVANAVVDSMISRHPWGLAVMATLTIILAIIAIFNYKNRKKQIKFVNIATLTAFMWYVAFAAYTLSIKGRTDFAPTFEVASLFPLLSLLTLYLAKRAIKHDEALVRAADRIR